MILPTTPVTFTTPYGPLYIAVIAADRHSYHDTERGDVTDLRPHLRIASDPTFSGSPKADEHWTIRRRAYAVHYEIFFEDRTKIKYAAADMVGERWHRSGYTPYGGGFRNDMRVPVEFRTKTFNLMWDAVSATLDTFDASHTGWQNLSRYLLHEQEAAAERHRADEARKEAKAHDAKADQSAVEAACLAADIPSDVFSLTLAAKSSPTPAKENQS